MTKKTIQGQSAKHGDAESRTDVTVAVWVVFAGLSCIMTLAGDLGLVRIERETVVYISRVAYLAVLAGCIVSAALRLTRALQDRRDGS